MEAQIAQHNIRAFQRAATTTLFPKWVVYLFVATVFSKEIGHITLGGVDFDLIGYTFCIVYLIWFFNRLYFSQTLNVVLFLILITSIAAKFYLNLPFPALWKQYVPIVVIYLTYYDFFRRFNNYKKLFEMYVDIAYLTAIFGLIQLFVKAVFAINLLTDYSTLFVDSVAYEPSHYASLILPACVYSIMRFKANKLRATIILLAAMCTFTATTYLVFMIVIVLIFANPFYLLVLLPTIYFLFSNVFLDFERFQFRFQGFSDYFEKGALNQVRSATTLSFLSNVEVAQYSISKSPIFGSGLGGNETMYERYFEGNIFRYHYLYGINAPAAHNLLIRVFSELGLAGALAYIFFLVKGLILKGPLVYRMISIAAFSHFICKALKLGGYFDYGTPFFVMLLWFNFVEYRKVKQVEAGER